MYESSSAYLCFIPVIQSVSQKSVTIYALTTRELWIRHHCAHLSDTLFKSVVVEKVERSVQAVRPVQLLRLVARLLVFRSRHGDGCVSDKDFFVRKELGW